MQNGSKWSDPWKDGGNKIWRRMASLSPNSQEPEDGDEEDEEEHCAHVCCAEQGDRNAAIPVLHTLKLPNWRGIQFFHVYYPDTWVDGHGVYLHAAFKTC